MTQYRLEYAARYFRRLEDIKDYISAENPAAAQRLLLRIRTAVERLAFSPGLGRAGRVPGTRELVIAATPYIVPYRVRGDAVQVITIMHSSQKWPDRFP